MGRLDSGQNPPPATWRLQLAAAAALQLHVHHAYRAAQRAASETRAPCRRGRSPWPRSLPLRVSKRIIGGGGGGSGGSGSAGPMRARARLASLRTGRVRQDKNWPPAPSARHTTHAGSGGVRGTRVSLALVSTVLYATSDVSASRDGNYLGNDTLGGRVAGGGCQARPFHA
eukprot:scaffold2162_cov398-Prasinococcus_capsulatus_cf.AAC.29